MNIRYACIAAWDSGYDEIFNLRLRENLQEGSYLWRQAYDGTASDHADTHRRQLGSVRLSSSL